MSVRRRSVRKNLPDNSNSKRWSQPPAETNEQEEQISSKSSYLTLLTTKLGIPKEKAYVKKLRLLFLFPPLFIVLVNVHASPQVFVRCKQLPIGKR